VASTFAPDHRAQSTAARFFLLALGITAASIALNLLVPQLATTEQSLVFVGVVAAVLVGLWRGLGRAEPNASARLILWFAVAIPWGAWLVLVWWLALLGAFRTGGRLISASRCTSTTYSASRARSDCAACRQADAALPSIDLSARGGGALGQRRIGEAFRHCGWRWCSSTLRRTTPWPVRWTMC
jgi:hypothetical protein